MAYIYNGGYRNYILVVEKQDANGNSASGYPKSYNLLQDFSVTSFGAAIAYGALTETEFARLSETAYLKRLNDFYNYINAQNAGLDVLAVMEAGQVAYGTNEAMCPPGTTPPAK